MMKAVNFKEQLLTKIIYLKPIIIKTYYYRMLKAYKYRIYLNKN